MNKLFLSFFLILLSSCTSMEEKPRDTLDIQEINPDRKTALTKQNIIQLTQVYDLTPLLFEKKIVIRNDVKSDSDPSIDLNSKDSDDPEKLLSSLLHEEFHWWYSNNTNKTAQAEKELRQSVGIDKKDTGHLIVMYLEFSSLKYFLGEAKARKVFGYSIRSGKFSSLYRVVLKNYKTIDKIMKKHDLVPQLLL